MDGKSWCGRKGKGENERWQKRGKEGEGKERRERERGTKNGENGARGALPSPDAFPNVKLENNMTPKKGRLGKNTTPTSRSPTKQKQNLQVDPRRRRSSLEVASRPNLVYTPGKTDFTEYGLQSNGASIYKETKAFGNSCNRSKFSINQH